MTAWEALLQDIAVLYHVVKCIIAERCLMIIESSKSEAHPVSPDLVAQPSTLDDFLHPHGERRLRPHREVSFVPVRREVTVHTGELPVWILDLSLIHI